MLRIHTPIPHWRGANFLILLSTPIWVVNLLSPPPPRILPLLIPSIYEFKCVSFASFFHRLGLLRLFHRLGLARVLISPQLRSSPLARTEFKPCHANIHGTKYQIARWMAPVQSSSLTLLLIPYNLQIQPEQGFFHNDSTDFNYSIWNYKEDGLAPDRSSSIQKRRASGTLRFFPRASTQKSTGISSPSWNEA